MGRSETPLDPTAGPLAEFAFQLRELRRAAGNRSYRDLARRAHYSASTLSIAASGKSVPSLAVVLAYVRVCGGDVEDWTGRWQEMTAELPEAGSPALPNATPSTWAAGGGADESTAEFWHGTGSVLLAENPRDRRAAPGSASLPRPATRTLRRGAALLATTAAVATTVAVVMAASAPYRAATMADRPSYAPRAAPAASLFHGGIYDEIAGPGCPAVPGASSAAQTRGDGWSTMGAAGRSQGGEAQSAAGGLPACGGAALMTRTTGSIAAVQDTYTWTFRPGRAVTCTLEVYVAAMNPSSSIARYDVYPATMSIADRIDAVQLDQAPHHGQWITVGTYPARDGVLRLQLTDQSAYPGATYHVTASAAEATCR